jgi:hypothetical protein
MDQETEIELAPGQLNVSGGEYGDLLQSSAAKPSDLEHHRYMILSKQEEFGKQKFYTTVFDSRKGLASLENGGFSDSHTIFVGELFSETRIIQVLERDILLLDSTAKVTQKLSIIPEGLLNDKMIASCSVADLYVALLLSSGEMVLLQGNEYTRSLTVMESPYGSQVSRVRRLLSSLSDFTKCT